TKDRHRTVDDRPYGGGPGMVMMFEPLQAAIRSTDAALGGGAHVVALTPQGRQLDQRGVGELVQRERLLLVAGRYEGIDERLIEAEIDEEWS
ncbi:tRNA (guanosine(37)-N1)-methyltransferase TrmD, partial [Klebsiella pneumoniae]